MQCSEGVGGLCVYFTHIITSAVITRSQSGKDFSSLASVVWPQFSSRDLTMLKHCSSLSLAKCASLSSVSSSRESLCLSSPPTPRSPNPQHSLVKVWADKDSLSLANKMSYTTIMVDKLMTSRDVIRRLLNRLKIKSADPDMYRLCLAVETAEGERRERRVRLENSCRLLDLISCTPWLDFRLILQAEETIKLRFWDNIGQFVLFRSILVSRHCTVGVARRILHQFYPQLDINSLALFEECPELGFKRQLSEEELLAKILDCWGEKSQCRFSLEQLDINNNQRSSISTGLKARSLDRKMFDFLRSFLEEQSERNSDDDEFISLEEDYKSENTSVNSDSFLYIAF